MISCAHAGMSRGFTAFLRAGRGAGAVKPCSSMVTGGQPFPVGFSGVCGFLMFAVKNSRTRLAVAGSGAKRAGRGRPCYPVTGIRSWVIVNWPPEGSCEQCREIARGHNARAFMMGECKQTGLVDIG